MREAVKHMLLEQVKETGSCRVRVGGWCMTPVVRHGARVTVVRTVLKNVREGDILAYFMGTRLLVHRVVRKQEQGLTMQADNGRIEEHEIGPTELLGRIENIENPTFMQRQLQRIRDYATEIFTKK